MIIEFITGFILGIEILKDEDFDENWLCIELGIVRILIPIM